MTIRRPLWRWFARVGVLGVGLFGGLGVFTSLEADRIGKRHPSTGRFVEVAGGRLHYTERKAAGNSRGTVLLLHGASGNQADLMLPLGDRLAAVGFDVIAVDRPGHGWSDRPDGAADAFPPRQAALIREAMQHLGIRHAIVVGHSWSGALAANLALDQPDFTDGLVLLAPVTHPWTTGIAWYYSVAAGSSLGSFFTHTLVLPIGLALLPSAVQEVFAPGVPPDDFVARTGIDLVFRPRDFTANAQDVDALLGFVTTQGPRMSAIRVPTAIVAGDGDRVASPDLHSRVDARTIPGATLTILHNVGHSPHWADPDAVVEAIRSVADRAAANHSPFGSMSHD